MHKRISSLLIPLLTQAPVVMVLFGLFAVKAATLNAAALAPLPSWFGDANTTYQSYIFSTNSLSPAPEEMTNPFGSPTALIEVVPSLGVGVGYQDPDPNVPSINRTGGAWDLGPAGSMLFEIPVGPALPSGQFYVVDVFVNVIYESGLYYPPNLVPTPSATVLTTTDDPNYDQIGIVPWGLRSSEASLTAVSGDTISLLLDVPGETGVTEDTGSIVDTVELHTSYEIVPEPLSFPLVTGLCALLLLGLRRRLGS